MTAIHLSLMVQNNIFDIEVKGTPMSCSCVLLNRLLKYTIPLWPNTNRWDGCQHQLWWLSAQMWGAMAKPGRTGQSAIMRTIQKTEWGWYFFQFVDFCQLRYVHYPYFKKLLCKRNTIHILRNCYAKPKGIKIFLKRFKTGSYCESQSVLPFCFTCFSLVYFSDIYINKYKV